MERGVAFDAASGPVRVVDPLDIDIAGGCVELAHLLTVAKAGFGVGDCDSAALAAVDAQRGIPDGVNAGVEDDLSSIVGRNDQRESRCSGNCAPIRSLPMCRCTS